MIMVDGEINEDAVVFRGVTHGVIDLRLLPMGDLSCGYHMAQTFECPNCGRLMCWCAGHDACDLCDQCCIGCEDA